MNPTVDKARIVLTMNVDETGTPSGGGGGGGGDASAANQVLSNAKLDAINGVLGVVGDTWDGITANPTIHGATKLAAERIDALASDVINNTTPATVAQDSSRLRIGGTDLTPKFAVITASASGATAVVAAVTGKRIRVISYVVTRSADTVNYKFQSASTDITGLHYSGAAGNFNPVGHFQTAVGEALNINLSAATAVGGELTYVEV